MSKHIAFITDPLETLNPQNDTTLALMHAAQERGYEVFWMEASDLHINHDTPVGFMSTIQLSPGAAPSLGASFLAPLDELSLIWWRKAPPYDLDMHFALDTLQLLKHTPVLNTPHTLRSTNEHLFPLQFPKHAPPSLVSKSPKALRAFLSEIKGKSVLRALSPKQSHNSFFLRMGDPNLKVLTEVLTHNSKQYALAQKLITEPGLDGDKRIFLVDGELLGIALQIPAAGDMRGSFERGAEPSSCEMSDKDHAVVRAIGRTLKEKGIFLATIDVSDGYIIDCNLSSPSGLVELQKVSQFDVFDSLFSSLQGKMR